MADLTNNTYEKLSAERKQLQREGRLPNWYLTGGWSMFKQKYLYEAPDVRAQFKRIARTAAKHLIDVGIDTVKEAEDKFFDMLWSGVLSASTPVLSNTGTNRGLPVSCQGSYIPDSIDGIYSGKRELALHTKHGFGTSAYLGDIRSRGTRISIGGKAEGIQPVFKGLIQDSQYVSQGNTRRGSVAVYLPFDHADFDEIVDFVTATPEDANLGFNFSDANISRLEAQDPELLRRFKRLMKMKMVTGRGYLSFIDKMNRLAPPAIKNSGIPIVASNLCVAGDTRLLTEDGEFPIAELVGRTVNVWNGIKFTPALVAKTGENQKLLEIKFESCDLSYIHTETSIKCTPYHKFYDEWGDVVTAEELVRDEYLQPFFLPKEEGSVIDNGYRHFKVVSIESTDSADTYCVNEPTEHKAVFNGVLTGNCNEIALPSNEEYSFICVLSSMNLVHWDKLKDSDDIFWATIFLDCINSEFISKAKHIPGLEKSVKFAKDFAALGLGACGLHTLFQQKMIPWESFQAHQLNNEIFARMDSESRRASEWLAEKRGCAKFAEGTGMRNATRLAIAPTKSTALLMGGVSEGINPDPAMTYTQASAGGDLLRVNALILSRMRERGAYKKSEFDSINAASGSVQHVSWLDNAEKEVFKTAFEINMESVIRMASARQRRIDQGQSLNLYFAANEDPKWISHIHRMAMLDDRIKGLYYVYSTRTLKGASRECVACQ